MNDHLDPEALSTYIDEEIELGERERIESHLTQCSDCQRVLEMLRGAASAVSRLEEASVTPDQHRMLRQAVLDARPGIRKWGPVWGLAGVTALVVVGALGFLNVQDQGSLGGSNDREVASGPALETRSFDFVSDEQIRSVVASQGQVASGIDKFTVADVGSQQEPAIAQALSSTAAAGLSRYDEVAEGSGAGGRSSSPSTAFSPAAGQICVRKVLRSQIYPMIPLLAAPASYKQKPAWLLVYAFTADQTSASRLDRAQIWLISPEECARLEGAALINAAYHYSFYRKS